MLQPEMGGMDTREAYLFYEAGQAVAAAHLGLRIRRVSGDAVGAPTEIVVPRNRPKMQMILWLTGMAAERKGLGRSHPLRRMRNRVRVRALLDGTIARMTGSKAKRAAARRAMLSQAQDRANAICGHLFAAIEELAERLRRGEAVSGAEVVAMVRAVKEGSGGMT